MSTERDTKFAGFAKLLIDEIKAEYAWVEPFQGDGSEMDDLHIYIARRAYDLVQFTLNQTLASHPAEGREFPRLYKPEDIRDMTELPSL